MVCLSKHDISVDTACVARLIKVYLRVCSAAPVCAASVIPSPLSCEIGFSKSSLNVVSRLL